MTKTPLHSTTKRLVKEKLAESLITVTEAPELGLRPIEASEIARLPNIPPGPHNPGLLIVYFDLDRKPLPITDSETEEKVLMYRVRYLPPLGKNGFARSIGSQHEQSTRSPYGLVARCTCLL